MAEIKVEDLMQSIRDGAREGAAQTGDSAVSGKAGSARTLGRLETNLAVTGRAHDQLPPVTTYRQGLLARLELWIKRQLKRSTHWYTWEQVNFNLSTHTALKHILEVLQTYEQRLANLQTELDASVASKSNLEARLAELESTLAQTEIRFDRLLAQKTAEVRREDQKLLEMLANEQRVCLKQLALEISETGVIADRTKRSMQLKLDELAARVDEMTGEQREIENVGRDMAADRRML